MTDTPEEQKVKGYVEQGTGRVKKAAGELLDDPKLKKEGAIEEIQGKAKEHIGEVRKRFDEKS